MTGKRQLQIAGTERKEFPEVEKAAEAYVVVRDERAELAKRETQKKLELLAVMRTHKLTVYKFYDDDGEEMVARVDDGEPKVSVKKTGEAEPEIGEGISSDDDHPTGGVPQGLIDQAMKAQDDANIGETEEGDVIPLDKAAPKKRGKKAKKS